MKKRVFGLKKKKNLITPLKCFGRVFRNDPTIATEQPVNILCLLSNPLTVSTEHIISISKHVSYTGRSKITTDLRRPNLNYVNILARSQNGQKRLGVNLTQEPSVFRLSRLSGIKDEPSQVNIWDKAVLQHKSNRCGFLPSPPTCVEPCPRSASCSAPPATTQNRHVFFFFLLQML